MPAAQPAPSFSAARKRGEAGSTIQNSIASVWPMLRHASIRSALDTSTSPDLIAGVCPATCTWTRPVATATIAAPIGWLDRLRRLPRAEVHEFDQQVGVGAAEKGRGVALAVLHVIRSSANPISVGTLTMQQIVDGDPKREAELRQRAEREASLSTLGLRDGAGSYAGQLRQVVLAQSARAEAPAATRRRGR